MRVFVSSTSKDLRPYRDAARAVVLDLGDQPVMMEHFGADGSRGIVEACRRRVEEADIVLAILAWKRGAVPEADRGGDGRASYTKWELDAAFHAGKPVLVFMASESWPGHLWEDDPEARTWVRSFRGELDRLAVLFDWEDAVAGAEEPLPVFRAKVRQELLRARQPRDAAPDSLTGIRHRIWPRPPWPERPYPLLLPYTHPSLFAGRTRELAELRRLLRLPVPILGLHAPSGAGKSSLLAAGLVPALRAEERPVAFERRPAEPGLADRLAGDLLEADGGEASRLAAGENDPQTFVRLLRAAERSSGETPLVVLDQFEDVMRPELAEARARLGLLLAASIQRQPGREGPPCRWLLAYREDFHGRVSAWLRDVLKEARVRGLPAAEHLPHELADADRFHAWPLPLLGSPPPGGDQPVARVFQDAIETPLALTSESGGPRYPWRFAGDGAERLARAFAAAREAQPDAPLVPELQVTLAHLLEEAGEPGGAEPALVTVPEDLEEVIGQALENHLHRALDAAFLGQGGAAAREGQTRVLLALRELADADGKRGESLGAAELAAAIGERGEEILETLARRDIRVLVPLERSGGRRFALSHDRLAEVVVRTVEEEAPCGDLDRDMLRLRRFVRLNTELHHSDEGEQATRIPRRRFQKIAEHREALIRGEQQKEWWRACEQRRQVDRRRNLLVSTVGLTLLVALSAAVSELSFRRAERTKLLAEMKTQDSRIAFGALHRLFSEDWVGIDELREELHNRGDSLDLFEQGADGVDEESRYEAMVNAVEVAQPLDLTGSLDELEEIGLMAWMLDYATAHDRTLHPRADALRLRLLGELEPRPEELAEEDWVEIPAASFEMGSDVGDEDEKPPHQVEISAILMLKHEVTNKEFRRLFPTHEGDDELPAVNVRWYQAYAYAAWLGGRLPTEAEWEYAAGAGCRYEYCNRDGEEAQLVDVGWFRGNSEGHLHPVKELEPNPWGLYDMHGNAWEWVGDWFGSYSADPQVDPWGPSTGGDRVIRGGGFGYVAGWTRAANRNLGNPRAVYLDQGFRVVIPPAAPSR